MPLLSAFWVGRLFDEGFSATEGDAPRPYSRNRGDRRLTRGRDLPALSALDRAMGAE